MRRTLAIAMLLLAGCGTEPDRLIMPRAILYGTLRNDSGQGISQFELAFTGPFGRTATCAGVDGQGRTDSAGHYRVLLMGGSSPDSTCISVLGRQSATSLYVLIDTFRTALAFRLTAPYDSLQHDMVLSGVTLSPPLLNTGP